MKHTITNGMTRRRSRRSLVVATTLIVMSSSDRTPLDAADAEIAALEAQLERPHAQLSEARRRRPAEQVHDHEVVVAEGSVPLSSLFGAHDDLLLIHTMGRTCASCTLWADGFNGFLQQLESRAAVVLLSPTTPPRRPSSRPGVSAGRWGPRGTYR
jgi:predicted dithiol-disulfide oxidoreductase (DUF899 family)